MQKEAEVDTLRAKISELEHQLSCCKEEKKRLFDEVEFLRTHPSILQGLKGERLLCSLTGGTVTTYSERYDLIFSDVIKVEIKLSKLNTPVHGAPTRRWNWSKPLGIFDQGKEYDFLVLLGEKDNRFPDQYLDDSPYVCFFIPRKDVESLMSKGKTVGGMLQINSNLRTARAEKSKLIKKYMVPMLEIEQLLSNALA